MTWLRACGFVAVVWGSVIGLLGVGVLLWTYAPWWVPAALIVVCVFAGCVLAAMDE